MRAILLKNKVNKGISMPLLIVYNQDHSCECPPAGGWAALQGQQWLASTEAGLLLALQPWTSLPTASSEMDALTKSSALKWHNCMHWQLLQLFWGFSDAQHKHITPRFGKHKSFLYQPESKSGLISLLSEKSECWAQASCCFLPLRKCFTKVKTWKLPDAPRDENEDEDVKAERLRVKEALSNPNSEEVTLQPQTPNSVAAGGCSHHGSWGHGFRAERARASLFLPLSFLRCQRLWSAACTRSMMRGRSSV